MKDIDLEINTPKGYSPAGVAKRKQETRDAYRHHKVTERQDSTSEDN